MGNRIFSILLALGILSGCKNAEDYFSEGQDLYLDGYYKQAIIKYNRAIQTNQYLKDSYIQMGNCYEYLNQHDSALKAYSALLKIYPDNTAANYYSGVSKYRQQKYAEAIPYYDRALDSKTQKSIFRPGKYYMTAQWPVINPVNSNLPVMIFPIVFCRIIIPEPVIT